MKLTESRLRNIVREELQKLTERTTADDALQDIKFELEQNMGYSNIEQVESSGRIKDGDMGARLILPQGTTVRVDIGSVLMVDAASRQELQDVKRAAKNTRNYQVIEESKENKLRNVIREELSRLTEANQEMARNLANEIRRMGYEAQMKEKSHYGPNVVLMGEPGRAPNAVVHFENGQFVVNTGDEKHVSVARKAANNIGYSLVDNTTAMDPTEPTQNAKIRRGRKDRFDREI